MTSLTLRSFSDAPVESGLEAAHTNLGLESTNANLGLKASVADQNITVEVVPHSVPKLVYRYPDGTKVPLEGLMIKNLSPERYERYRELAQKTSCGKDDYRYDIENFVHKEKGKADRYENSFTSGEVAELQSLIAQGAGLLVSKSIPPGYRAPVGLGNPLQPVNSEAIRNAKVTEKDLKTRLETGKNHLTNDPVDKPNVTLRHEVARHLLSIDWCENVFFKPGLDGQGQRQRIEEAKERLNSCSKEAVVHIAINPIEGPSLSDLYEEKADAVANGTQALVDAADKKIKAAEEALKRAEESANEWISDATLPRNDRNFNPPSNPNTNDTIFDVGNGLLGYATTLASFCSSKVGSPKYKDELDSARKAMALAYCKDRASMAIGSVILNTEEKSDGPEIFFVRLIELIIQSKDINSDEARKEFEEFVKSDSFKIVFGTVETSQQDQIKANVITEAMRLRQVCSTVSALSINPASAEDVIAETKKNFNIELATPAPEMPQNDKSKKWEQTLGRQIL